MREKAVTRQRLEEGKEEGKEEAETLMEEAMEDMEDMEQAHQGKFAALELKLAADKQCQEKLRDER